MYTQCSIYYVIGISSLFYYQSSIKRVIGMETEIKLAPAVCVYQRGPIPMKVAIDFSWVTNSPRIKGHCVPLTSNHSFRLPPQASPLPGPHSNKMNFINITVFSIDQFRNCAINSFSSDCSCFSLYAFRFLQRSLLQIQSTQSAVVKSFIANVLPNGILINSVSIRQVQSLMLKIVAQVRHYEKRKKKLKLKLKLFLNHAGRLCLDGSCAHVRWTRYAESPKSVESE